MAGKVTRCMIGSSHECGGMFLRMGIDSARVRCSYCGVEKDAWEEWEWDSRSWADDKKYIPLPPAPPRPLFGPYQQWKEMVL